MQSRTCAIVTTALTIVAFAGCLSIGYSDTTPERADVNVQPASGRAAAAKREDSGPAAGMLLTGDFGDSRWGFVQISSANGRLVVLRRFHEPDKPSFAMHGEVIGQEPQLTVFDRFSGEQTDLAEIIDIDSSRRWLLAISQDQLWLIDAENGKREVLAGADMDSDGNACLPPRHGSFSAKGRQLGWIVDGGRSVSVRELSTAREWSYAARGRVWRAWPDDEGNGITVADMDPSVEGFPRQDTSCACIWCGRFAKSYGFYGWSGPSWTFEHVAGDGTRSEGVPPDGEGSWHGETESGCELKAAYAEENLEKGPWRWDCGQEPDSR